MKTLKTQLSVIALGMSSALLGGCFLDDDDEAAASQAVLVAFEAEVAGQTFTCGDTFTGVGSGGHDFTVNDFRLYVHDLHVHDINGNQVNVTLDQDGAFQLDNLALLDFENGCGAGTTEMNTVITGTVPGDVDLTNTEMCFVLGVPEDMNHIDAAVAASPLNDTSMLWAWKIGRKFIRIDGVGDPAGTHEAFNIHLGSQGDCGTGGPTEAPTQACTVPNTVEVCFDNVDLASGDHVVIDPAGVLEFNDISFSLGGTNNKPGCQSFAGDEDCAEVMPRLGLDYSYGGVSGSSTYTGGQKLFTLHK